MSFKLGGELLSYPANQGRKPEPGLCKRIRNSNGNADGIGARSIARHPDGQGEPERVRAPYKPSLWHHRGEASVQTPL